MKPELTQAEIVKGISALARRDGMPDELQPHLESHLWDNIDDHAYLYQVTRDIPSLVRAIASEVALHRQQIGELQTGFQRQGSTIAELQHQVQDLQTWRSQQRHQQPQPVFHIHNTNHVESGGYEWGEVGNRIIVAILWGFMMTAFAAVLFRPSFVVAPPQQPQLIQN